MNPGMNMEAVTSFSRIDAHLCTSSQLSSEQLSGLGGTGLMHVINLALPSSDNAVSDEGARLAAQGISYVNIPVSWENPDPAQFTLFAQILWAMRDDNVLVHCACNMRASAFVFLYRVLHEAVPVDEAAVVMDQVWQPEGVWLAFIRDLLEAQGIEYVSLAEKGHG